MCEPTGPTVTVAVPVAERQPRALVSVTDRVRGVPSVPAVKVIWLVPRPEVMVPFVMTH